MREEVVTRITTNKSVINFIVEDPKTAFIFDTEFLSPKIIHNGHIINSKIMHLQLELASREK